MQRPAGARGRTGSGKRIAYIIGTYPSLTTTFVDREIREAKRVGLDLVLVAIRRARFGVFSPAVQDMIREITYLLPVSVYRLAGAHLYFLFRHAWRYLGALVYLLTRQHPTSAARVKTLLHFGEGVLAAALLKDRGVDHVHAHFADRAVVVAMVLNRLLRVPYSLTAHAVDIYRSPSFLTQKIANAKFAVTCTGFNKAHLERETGRPIELVYHGLDFSAFPEAVRREQAQSPPLILSIGQLREKKGFPYLIQACALLRERGYDFRCEILGEGPSRETLAELIRQLDLGSFVTLCGSVPHDDVLLKYPKASVFVLPCVVADDGDRDGIPNVILEAMAFGLPVVSTEVSGIPEVIRNGQTGLLVSSRSVDELTGALESVLRNPEDAETLGQNAATFVRREFDIRRNVGRLIELLRG